MGSLHAKTWGEGGPERGSSMCQGPEVGNSVARSRKKKEAGMFGK